MQHWHLVGMQQIIFILIILRLHRALILHPPSIGRKARVRFPLGKGLLAMGFRN